MLAAAPSIRDNALDLFCLALSLITQNEQNIPTGLKEYFERVVREARVLAANPTHASVDFLPEAIQLALEMRRHRDFSRMLDDISNVTEVSPQIAGKILHTVEQSFAYQS